MDILFVKLEDLNPYENNPRNNENAVEYVKNSIMEFGFKVPIVIDRDYVIVCGHTRRLASIKLGLDKVPCYIATDLTDEQVRAFRLADNRVASFATWDEEKLKEEIAGIADIDITAFGFREETIKDIFREKQKVHVCPKCGYEWSDE